MVPLVSAQLGAKAVTAINSVQALLTSEQLRALNRCSTGEELDSATIATQWLTDQGLLG